MRSDLRVIHGDVPLAMSGLTGEPSCVFRVESRWRAAGECISTVVLNREEDYA